MVINYERPSCTKKKVFKILLTTAMRQEHQRSISLRSLLVQNSYFVKRLSTNLKSLPQPKWDWCCKRLKKWFHDINLGHLSKLFHNFNGSDILRLSKDDIYSICGQLYGNLLCNCLFNLNNNHEKLLSLSVASESRFQIFIRIRYFNFYNLVYFNPNLNELVLKLKNLLLNQYFSEDNRLMDDKVLEFNDEFNVCEKLTSNDELRELDSVFMLNNENKIVCLVDSPLDFISNDDKFMVYLICLRTSDKKCILIVRE
jgi:hypothetical protein